MSQVVLKIIGTIALCNAINGCADGLKKDVKNKSDTNNINGSSNQSGGTNEVTASPSPSSSPSPNGGPATDSGTVQAKSSTTTPAAIIGINVGDKWTNIDESKSWTSKNAEPQTWSSRSQTVNEVLKVYDDNQFCRYRIKTATNNLKVSTSVIAYGFQDILCRNAEGACSGTPQCKTSNLDALTSGPFVGAKGERRVCTLVSCSGNATQRIQKVDTQIWRHNAAKVPDGAVKILESTCTMDLKKGDKPSDFSDACDSTKSRAVSYSKRTSVLENQTPSGLSKVRSAFGAASSIAVNQTPVKGNAIFLPATCNPVSASAISISMGRTFCDGTGKSSENFTLSRVDLTSTDANGANQYIVPYKNVSISYDSPGAISTSVPTCPLDVSRTFKLAKTGYCKVHITGNEEEGVLIGTGSCQDVFEWKDQSLRVDQFSFVCNAPKDFDFGVLDLR
ncbi:MAG: hypothetical protein NT027_20300 [Proteobacteria bacterium]|nr:hypothetical protein [Pseudomonadota bacterium]